jgi:hypothetical protein
MEVEYDVAIGGIANNCSVAPLNIIADAPAIRTSCSLYTSLPSCEVRFKYIGGTMVPRDVRIQSPLTPFL